MLTLVKAPMHLPAEEQPESRGSTPSICWKSKEFGISYLPMTEALEIDDVSRISAAKAEAGDRRVDGGKGRCSEQNACWLSMS